MRINRINCACISFINRLLNQNSLINMQKTKLTTEQLTPNWFITRGHINGKFCIGYGTTQANSIADAFKDYQVIINL